MKSLQVLGLVAAMGVVAACAGPTTLPTVEYLCQDRTALRVTYVEDHAMVLTADGYLVRLPRQVTASGFRYADDRHELRGKDNEVTWTLAGGATRHCRAPGS